MGLWSFQTNFNRGELDPQLTGRIDLAAYYAGMKTANNVLTIPQGGVKKRPGMEFLNTGLGNGRIENFSFNVEQSYLLVFTALKMEIYKDGVLQTNINGSGDNFLVTPYTLAQLADIDYIQSADTAIIVHPDQEPKKITRTSDTAWTIAVLGLTNVPQFDFNDGSSPTPVSEVQTLNFINQTEGDRYKLALEGILTDEIVFAGDDAANQENIRIALQDLINTANTGITVGTDLALDTYRVTFANESAKDWDLLTATTVLATNVNFGVATVRITAGTARTEDAFSAGRGWPRTTTFHEGRLLFGGAKSRPATVFGSRVADFFNFDQGRARDDEGIEATIDTDQVNAIEAIFSNRSLQIFTSGGEFFVKESPLTPSNIAIVPQSNLGAKRVRPVTIDGITLFVQRTGKAINQFVFINEFQANQSRSVSVLASHIINNPVKMAVSRGTSTDDANYVYILGDDGNVTVFNTLISEDVTAFTTWKTTGNIKSIAVVDNVVFFLVERTINAVVKFFVERENDLLNTDSAVRKTGLASATLTGLDHLNTETVVVKADGAAQDDEVVVGGSITIERVANIIEAGLKYQPTIKTMPLNVPLNSGPNAADKKRIKRVAVNIFESNGIIVNGQRIADKTIGLDQFDAPSPQTGVRRVFIHGWSLEADVTITQDTPFPLQILSLGLEVKT